MIRILEKRHIVADSRREDGTLDSTADYWSVTLDTPAGIISRTFPLEPTPDDMVASVPITTKLAPTAAVGKAALKDLLDAQIAQAQAWDWFATKVAVDAGVPAAAKTAVQGLADAEYAEAKRLALAWRAAT